MRKWRTLVRIEKVDNKGVLCYLNGWNWRKKIRIKSFPPKLTLTTVKPESGVYYAYAMVYLDVEYAKDLEVVWCD